MLDESLCLSEVQPGLLPTFPAWRINRIDRIGRQELPANCVLEREVQHPVDVRDAFGAEPTTSFGVALVNAPVRRRLVPCLRLLLSAPECARVPDLLQICCKT